MNIKGIRRTFEIFDTVNVSENQLQELENAFLEDSFMTPRNFEVPLVDEEYIYFVEEGILRVFYENRAGKECNMLFLTEGSFIILNPSDPFLYKNAIRVKAIGRAKIYRISKKRFIEILGNEENYLRFYKLIREILHSTVMQNYINFLYKDSTERYQSVLDFYGEDTIRKITVKQLASFLGILPESLSRIRRNIL